jgi:Ras-related protein Rab-1A
MDMDDEKEYDYLFKILLIGDAAVGKSSILLKYTEGVFNTNYMSTIGIDFRIKSFEIEGKLIKL